MNIVLLEPRIPQNTGNIARTCVVTGSTLHLIEPLGFEITDKKLKRAGLDYWEYLDVKRYTNYQDFLEKNNYPEVFMATTKAKKTYCDVSYSEDSFIMFGREDAGIPEEILLENKEMAIRIPMHENIRSLNLSNSVAIVLYEALRQLDFPNLETKGQLHKYKW